MEAYILNSNDRIKILLSSVVCDVISKNTIGNSS